MDNSINGECSLVQKTDKATNKICTLEHYYLPTRGSTMLKCYYKMEMQNLQQ